MKQTMSNLALLLAACAITVFAKPVSRLSIAPENMNRCQQPSPELLAFEKQLAAKEANGTSKFKPSENLSVVEVDVHFHVFSESEEGFKAVTVRNPPQMYLSGFDKFKKN